MFLSWLLYEESSDKGYRKQHKALHMKDPKVFSKSMEKDCHKTMEEIHIQRVPVFLQLDLPASWSRTKVLEYLDEMRINETSDMNLRIIAVSPDDLNLYSEIARTVLSKVDLLKDEVQKLLSGMLLEAAIDTKESAEVGFNVTIPTITEETSEINSDDEHDCKTRTEFNDDFVSSTCSTFNLADFFYECHNTESELILDFHLLKRHE
ncbi:unnamed protein product [Mytilus edulis]|uniref:Uncharacterized protein n=1 Tax=Mytilus edulis TaxID=6550 RepID=A0A8S3UAL9_MYTED|nr:unnamed protein product [Mytilus edulis]